LRTAISIVIGGAMVIGGLWVFYQLIFEAPIISEFFLVGGGFVTFLGIALLWDTFKHRNTPPSLDD